MGSSCEGRLPNSERRFANAQLCRRFGRSVGLIMSRASVIRDLGADDEQNVGRRIGGAEEVHERREALGHQAWSGSGRGRGRDRNLNLVGDGRPDIDIRGFGLE